MSVTKFNLVKPCSNCPFTKKCVKGWLGEKRARELAEYGLNDKTFACHKTTDQPEGKHSQCAGALILTEKNGGVYQNYLFRLAAMSLGFKKEALKGFDEVFDTPTEMINYHSK